MNDFYDHAHLLSRYVYECHIYYAVYKCKAFGNSF